MADSKPVLELPSRENIVQPSIAEWIPRVIRCRSCGAMARERVRERVSNDEVVARFECGYCCHHETRHYGESDLLG